jgi:hypothetical protein
MTSATITMDAPDALTFAKNESKPLGMHGPLMDKLRDNAPRIVGGLKIIGDIVAASTLNPFLVTYAVFAITGRLIGIAYGTKANQEKLVKEVAAGKHQPSQDNSLMHKMGKIFSPRQYPVESSAGFSTIGEMFGVGYGFDVGKITPVVLGILAVLSYGYMAVGKEKRKNATSEDVTSEEETKPLVFAESKSKAMGFLGRVRQYMKENPVAVSSVMLIAISATAIVSGIAEGVAVGYIAAIGFGLAGSIVQMLLARKNEFNIEGAAEQKQTSHQDRLAERRDRDKDLGLQPA